MWMNPTEPSGWPEKVPRFWADWYYTDVVYENKVEHKHIYLDYGFSLSPANNQLLFMIRTRSNLMPDDTKPWLVPSLYQGALQHKILQIFGPKRIFFDDAPMEPTTDSGERVRIITRGMIRRRIKDLHLPRSKYDSLVELLNEWSQHGDDAFFEEVDSLMADMSQGTTTEYSFEVIRLAELLVTLVSIGEKEYRKEGQSVEEAIDLALQDLFGLPEEPVE